MTTRRQDISADAGASRDAKGVPLPPVADSSAGARRRRLRFELAVWALPLLLVAILVLTQSVAAVGGGYSAGWGDHFVLSPEGISWANPGAFANDWFMEVAPQPHWFFDVVTFIGASTGSLSVLYAVFWLSGLVAFAVATVFLARRFVPSGVWPVSIGVTLVASVTPWAIGGTGSGMIAQALPAVLSANLIYLLLSAMLTERRILVIVLAPLIAIVHVQQGSIAIVLLASLLLVEAVRLRTMDWFLLAATAGTGAFVWLGLSLRPVASNLQDFVRICDEVIPFHCAAHLWGRNELLSTIGLIFLASLSAVVIPRAKRWIWYATVGLAVLGYGGGFAADALRVPILDTLAQGVNVYRLGAVLLPFAVWGVFAPFLTAHKGWRRVAVIGVWAIGWSAFLFAPGFGTVLRPRLVVLFLALAVPLAWHLIRTRSAKTRRTDGFPALVAGLLVVAAMGGLGAFTFRVPNFAFIQSTELREWGEDVREVVPEGQVLIAPPRYEWIKLVTQRAVVADCKDVPYGGDAWDQWQERLNLLGGAEQCVAPGPLLYDELTPRALVALADRFDSDFIIVNPARPDVAEGLEAIGWTEEVGLVGTAGAPVFERPASGR